MTAPGVTYRPQIQVLDCTIRDGGLMNDHKFDDRFVKAVYETCVASGIDAMEIGYRNSKRLFNPKEFGPWKFSDEEDIRRIVGDNKTSLKISVMADAGKSDWQTEILPKKDSVVDIVRVACYVHQIPEAAEMIQDAHEKGYDVWCNIMAISNVSEAEIDQALEEIAKTPASVVVVVDSFGALYQEQVAILVKKYLKAVKGTGKEVGIHAHNNQQLAFANTIEAIMRGANRADSTMAGMGRGAGNCTTELLLGFLRNPKYKIRPVWKLLEEEVPAIRQQFSWGALPPYIITGQLDQHPRSAIAWMDGPDAEKCLKFYDKMMRDV